MRHLPLTRQQRRTQQQRCACLVPMSHAHFTTPIALRPIIMTPSSMLPSSATATLYSRCTMTGTYDAMLIDQDIVPQHMSHLPSILLPIYTRISPDDIVLCLDPGDELIVVIPPIGKNTTDLGCKVLWMYNKIFQNVIKQTCSNIHPADRCWNCQTCCHQQHLRWRRQQRRHHCHHHRLRRLRQSPPL
jgi:hypothetical protein